MANKKIRVIVKARTVAGSVCVSLPPLIRDPLGIEPGDRLLIEYDMVKERLIIEKE